MYGKSKVKNQKSKITAASAESSGEPKEDAVLLRLNRIAGQVSGIIKMYEKEKGCSDIVQQIIAVRAALGSVARVLLTNEAVRCARKTGNTKDLERSLESLIKIT